MSGDIIRIEGFSDLPKTLADADFIAEIVSDTQFYAVASGTGGSSPPSFAQNSSHIKLVSRADSNTSKYVSMRSLQLSLVWDLGKVGMTS